MRTIRAWLALTFVASIACLIATTPAARAAHRVALMLGHDHVRDAQRGVVLDRAIDGRADRAEADHRDVDGSVSVTHTGAPRACPS